MIHYNNFQNFMIHIKYYDTQQIHVSIHHLKHYTHLFKCIGKHIRFLKIFTNFNNSFKYQNTNLRQCRPNNNVCCFFFLFCCILTTFDFDVSPESLFESFWRFIGSCKDFFLCSYQLSSSESYILLLIDGFITMM